ncbi:PAS domain S-box protein [Paradesertivirga mongoliensis]|uniref:histidine kinase n=1 Tax=Paradesertivirga mongoliensis TaxID=2100740 RepID=A0ABW4ZL77_9SPHI|nr:PAS domain S-box protein [Pedobacter mongoliensis]
MNQGNPEEKSRDELLVLLGSYVQKLEVETRYHLILDNMIEGFQLLDSEFRYLYVNNTVVNQSRYSKDQLIGYTMTERYPGIENTPMFQALQDCQEKRISKTIENEFTYPDQSKAWFRLSIQPVEEGLFVLSMDITKTKKADQKREEHIVEIEQLLFKISHQVRQPVCHILGVAQLLDQSLVGIEDFNEFSKATKESIRLLDVYTRELTEFVEKMRMNADNEDAYRLYPPGHPETGS